MLFSFTIPFVFLVHPAPHDNSLSMWRMSPSSPLLRSSYFPIQWNTLPRCLGTRLRTISFRRSLLQRWAMIFSFSQFIPSLLQWILGKFTKFPVAGFDSKYCLLCDQVVLTRNIQENYRRKYLEARWRTDLPTILRWWACSLSLSLSRQQWGSQERNPIISLISFYLCSHFIDPHGNDMWSLNLVYNPHHKLFHCVVYVWIVAGPVLS